MIIFDLGGVLLNESDYNTAHVLPAGLDIELINGKPSTIFHRIFAFGELLFGPQCKRDWMLGTLPGQEIADRIFTEIEKPVYASLFKSTQERNLIKYGTPFVVVPEKLVPLTSLNQEGFEFVKQCKAQGIRIFVLSNWDPVSFAMIKDTFKELFALYDEQDIIIPAEVGYIKPELEIYEYIAQKGGFKPEEAVFIDDSVHNIAGSVEYGMRGIVHRSWPETKAAIRTLGYKI